jgi:hypothetical protein
VFDRDTLKALYPPGDYLEQFDEAVDDALAAGMLLPEGGRGPASPRRRFDGVHRRRDELSR